MIEHQPYDDDVALTPLKFVKNMVANIGLELKLWYHAIFLWEENDLITDLIKII